jgi:hypothetical protein
MSTESLLYDNGFSFTAGKNPLNGRDRLAIVLDQIRERVQKNKASMIIVDGPLGEGKTTLAVEIADYYNATEIPFKDFLFLGGDNFLKGIRVCYEKKMVVAIYDESGDFDKRGAMTKLNRVLGRLFDMFRAFKIVVILVLPSFFVLDKGLFEKNIPRVLLHCYGRKKYGSFSVYSLYRMHWLREKSKKCVPLSSAFQRVQPNFRGHFKNLSPQRSKELDTFSTAGKLASLDLATIKQQGLLNYDEIAAKLGLTNDTVRRKIASAGIQPVKTFKGKRYFDEKEIERLKK